MIRIEGRGTCNNCNTLTDDENFIFFYADDELKIKVSICHDCIQTAVKKEIANQAELTRDLFSKWTGIAR